MPTEIKKEIQLEIAHVLFTDIVGYSKLLMDEQHALLETLNQIVRGIEQFRNAEAAGKLIKIPTGDGMALAEHLPEAGARHGPIIELRRFRWSSCPGSESHRLGGTTGSREKRREFHDCPPFIDPRR